ncbi:MAG TPA: DUF2243 domain-containing protein [Bacteroidia bacterium]|jgi:uncharacterized membrane protein|nr:DUF2243 domain-containing protein [Bacteroidia bacterium]
MAKAGGWIAGSPTTINALVKNLIFMKKSVIILSSLLSPQALLACVTCNKGLQEQIKGSLNFQHLSPIIIIVLLIALITVTITKIITVAYRKKLKAHSRLLDPAPILSAGIILGVGLGGFLDGILLHQILQWHEMLSNEIDTITVNGKSVNMFWDGLFHMICLTTVCIGIYLLWKALLRPGASSSAKLAWSGLISGWGIFNITEGLIDHHLFKLHNVRETVGNENFYNVLFIIYSCSLLFLGWLLYKSEMKKQNGNAD